MILIMDKYNTKVTDYTMNVVDGVCTIKCVYNQVVIVVDETEGNDLEVIAGSDCTISLSGDANRQRAVYCKSGCTIYNATEVNCEYMCVVYCPSPQSHVNCIDYCKVVVGDDSFVDYGEKCIIVHGNNPKLTRYNNVKPSV